MAATTFDHIVEMLDAAQRFEIYKASATSEGAGTFHSLWKTGSKPAAGSNPPAYTTGSGYVPTDATTGAFTFTNPSTGKTYLVQFDGQGTTAGTLILYDRVWTCSGLTTNITTAQNITTPGTLSRPDSNGTGVEIFLEVYTAPGATGATWTITYTDQDGNTGITTTYTHPSNAESVGQMMPVPLAAGDTGVQAVTAFQCSVSSGTAGDIGITLVKRVAKLDFTAANIGVAKDFAMLGMPQIQDDACLALMVQCTATNTGLILGSMVLGQK